LNYGETGKAGSHFGERIEPAAWSNSSPAISRDLPVFVLTTSLPRLWHFNGNNNYPFRRGYSNLIRRQEGSRAIRGENLAISLAAATAQPSRLENKARRKHPFAGIKKKMYPRLLIVALRFRRFSDAPIDTNHAFEFYLLHFRV